MPLPDDSFTSAARAVLDGMLERHPEVATELGDHRHDDRLTIGTAPYYEETIRWCASRLRDLRAIDSTRLSPDNRVDLQILANQLELLGFSAGELREHEWNPMTANPGRAIYLLIARDFAPVAERLRCVARRLAAVPDALAAAREVLGSMPLVHIETALTQFAGAAHLIGAELDRVLALAGPAADMGSEMAAARSTALDAIDSHRRWLQQRLEETRQDGGARDPRIGAGLFARKLRLILDAETDPGEIVSRAEADLGRVTAQITATAARLAGETRRAGGSAARAGASCGAGGSGAGGPVGAAGAAGAGGSAGAGYPGAEPPAAAELVRQVLDWLAADAPDSATILALVERTFHRQLAFVREHAIVTTYDDPVEMIEMPEIKRGVAVAYCDPPGPLETAPTPTFVAVSPTPADWTPDRVRSFYREYNRHMIHNMMIHEGIPGHVLQLQHSRRFRGDTQVRAALRSGSFVEGWAVYAEQIMVSHGYPGEGNPDAMRMQQLKTQLRMIINAILDVRVHCEGMTEAEAMALMTGRGYQEEAEAAGKWRRALLTSAQLSTYYVGFTEVSQLAAELSAVHPALPQRQLHDMMLGHGSPPVRHLRTLLAA